MATNIKYRISYVDQLGVSTLINFVASSWSGSTTELNGTDTPLVISYPDPGERFAYIRGSEARISFYADSPYTYLPLFTSGRGSYKIEVYKNSLLHWEGFIYPSVYQQTLGSSPYIIEVTASDGLGRLDAYEFTDNSNNYLSGNISLLNAIRYCVVKTGCGMEVGDAVNLTHNLTTGSFLENTYINALAFIEDDEWMNCRDVLENILKTINARIYQDKGVFIVARFDQYGNNFTIKKYDASGGNTSTSSAEIKTLTNPDISLGTSLLALLENPTLSVEIPVKDITITNTLSESENINTGNFKPAYWYDDSTLFYWSNPDGIILEKGDDGESIFIQGTGTSPSNVNHIYQTINLENVPLSSLFLIKLKLSLYVKGGYSVNPYKFYLKVIYYNGGKTYWLNSDYEWDDYERTIYLDVPSYKFGDIDIESEQPILFNSFPSGGYLTIQLSQAYLLGGTVSSTNGLYVKNISLSNLYNVESLEKTTENTISNNNESSESRDIKFGIPNLINKIPEVKQIALGAILSNSGSIISAIQNKGLSYTDFADLLIADYTTFFGTPSEQLECNIMGYLTMNDTIQDSNHGSKKYMISGYSRDDKRCINEITMMEVTGSLDGSILQPLEDTLPYTLQGYHLIPLRLPTDIDF